MALCDCVRRGSRWSEDREFRGQRSESLVIACCFEASEKPEPTPPEDDLDAHGHQMCEYFQANMVVCVCLSEYINMSIIANAFKQVLF